MPLRYSRGALGISRSLDGRHPPWIGYVKPRSRSESCAAVNVAVASGVGVSRETATPGSLLAELPPPQATQARARMARIEKNAVVRRRTLPPGAVSIDSGYEAPDPRANQQRDDAKRRAIRGSLRRSARFQLPGPPRE